MIFKWTSKNKVATEVTEQAAAAVVAAPDAAPTPKADAPTETATPSQGAGQMARELFEKVVPFKSRSTLQEGDAGNEATLSQAFLDDGGLGQDHAIETLRFGAAVRGNDYNMIVSVPRGVDGAGLVRAVLKTTLKKDAASDWIYVPGLSDRETLVALPLPSSRAHTFKKLLECALAELQDSLPEIFTTESYQLRRLAIDEMHGREVDGALIDLIHRAAAKNVAVLRLPQGFSVAPMHDGKIVKPEVLSQLPETMRREVEARVRGFQSDIEALLARVPHLDRARRSELSDLHRDVVSKAAKLALSDVREAFADVPAALARLNEIEQDMTAHAPRIVNSLDREADIWRRYDVAVMQTSDKDAAPVIEMHDVRAEALVGRCEASPRAGALHRANNGALLISADAVLHDPDAREVMVRTLQSREITPLGETGRAEPIPFCAKIVLLGEPETCERLFNVDQRLARLFKLKITLARTMARTKESEAAFGEVVQALITRHKTKPIEASVTTLLIEEASRAAEGEALISLALEDTADLIREASAWAEMAGSGTIERQHASRALKGRDDRRGGASHDRVPASEAPNKVAKVLGS